MNAEQVVSYKSKKIQRNKNNEESSRHGSNQYDKQQLSFFCL